MSTHLLRPRAPSLMLTAERGHRKCLATNAMSSALALPSTGGDFNLACQSVAPCAGSKSSLVLAWGLTFTSMRIIA